MKKVYILGLLTLSFLGCAKKSTITPKTTITGKWYFSKSIIRDYKNGLLVSTTDTTENHKDYIVLNSDGTASENIAGSSDSFKYTATDKTITFIFPPYDPTDPNEANISNYSILKLDANNLAYLYTDSDAVTNESETVETDFVR